MSGKASGKLAQFAGALYGYHFRRMLVLHVRFRRCQVCFGSEQAFGSDIVE